MKGACIMTVLSIKYIVGWSYEYLRKYISHIIFILFLSLAMIILNLYSKYHRCCFAKTVDFCVPYYFWIYCYQSDQNVEEFSFCAYFKQIGGQSLF